MMINSYNAFAQNILNNRPISQRFSPTLNNPLLHSTPEAVTFELINTLNSKDSDSLSQFGSGFDDANFTQAQTNSSVDTNLQELPREREPERDTYIELLFINAKSSLFNIISEDGLTEMVTPDSDGMSLLTKAFQTQEQSDFQKIAAYNQNLLYHTTLSPVPATTTEKQSASDKIYELLAPLQIPEMQFATT
ncbi:MAG: hypothetical protein HQL70_05945 [Magnetococcales bacterium]|nr:hypothetical protein [Magnetococcales bacterium]